MPTRGAIRRAGALIVALVAVALLAACDPRSGPDGDVGRRFRAAECPSLITTDVLTPVTCGSVNVPERHADPSGPQIELFVARVLPDKPVSGEPALWLGYDVGGTVEYGSMATLAPRIHREVIILDARGTGFSRPHLGCPEVAEVAPEVVALPTGAEAGRAAYRDAVAACHRRLTGAGVDISAYGLDETAADVRDVMAALEIDTVHLFMGGTSSRYLTPLLAEADEGAFRRAVFNNGPLAALPDERTVAAGLEEALAAADALCDDACAITGRPSERLATLAAELDGIPLPTVTGDGRPVLLDGGRLRGIAAWRLEQSEGGATLAHELADAAAGRGDQEPLLTAERVLCLGQRPKCSAPDFSYGVWWTIRCQEPAADHSAFADDVCARWPVGRSQIGVGGPASSVPLLAVYGALSPYLPESARGLAGMSRRTVVVDPAWGQDVACFRSWRNRWIDDPEIEPEGLCPGKTPPVTGTRTWDD
jgi:hypothetical protein